MRLLMVRALLAGAFLAFTTGAHAQARPPVESFFKHPAFTDAAISPTGRHVALRVASAQGRVRLVVVDTESLKVNVAAGFNEADVTWFHWVSEKRLVFTLGDREGVLQRRVTSVPSGLMAVDLDGSEMRKVGTQRFHSATLMRDSEDVFVTQPRMIGARNNVLEGINILRLNTRTGDLSRAVATRPPNAKRWYLDAKDVPRVAFTEEHGQGALMWLDPATDTWTKLTEFNAVTGENATWPIAFGPDGTLYVRRGSTDGIGSGRVYRYDFQKKSHDPEPLISIQGFDAFPVLIGDKAKMLGFRYTSDAAGVVWFDAQYKEMQARVDKLLPGTINIFGVPVRGEVPVVLVRSSSDREPGIYSIYDFKRDKLTTLGREMPDIEPAAMGKRDLVRYKARDGLEIPAWLTLPPGKAPNKLPMVVLVHGGPWVRGGSWHWSAAAQFLASRGYAVLEPEFRGSTGYGYRHFKAGWKQWGLAMQDDITDGVRWAIESGTAEASRVCIAGASYGGYATLMGLIKEPEMFKCGVDIVGVTDIGLMYDIIWSDISDEAKNFGMPVLIGDPEKDAAQLKATSPLHNAERLKQPLLMAYGGSDRRVPIEHGLKFRDAVKKTNSDVEWVEYPEEGHGFYLLKNRVDFWTRVEKFLARNIGEGANPRN